jgi:hypothetical protein
MTKEIAEAIDQALNPLGVGVVIEASHMVIFFCSISRKICVCVCAIDLKLCYTLHAFDIELYFDFFFVYFIASKVYGEQR